MEDRGMMYRQRGGIAAGGGCWKKPAQAGSAQGLGVHPAAYPCREPPRALVHVNLNPAAQHWQA